MDDWTATPYTDPTLTDDQIAEVKARATGAGTPCQRQLAGCTHTDDQIQHAYTQHDLEYIKRDPISPDNWYSVCNNCAATPPPGGGS